MAGAINTGAQWLSKWRQRSQGTAHWHNWRIGLQWQEPPKKDPPGPQARCAQVASLQSSSTRKMQRDSVKGYQVSRA